MEIRGNVINSGEGTVRLIYLLLVTLAIILGNTLVIVAVGKFKKLRRTTNIMLASLAVADLLVGLLTVPLYIAWTLQPGIFDHSPFLCRTVLLSSLLVVAASQLNLSLLSVERYLAVCAPFKHRSILICCPWIHLAMVCLTWVVSLITTGLASLAIRSDYGMCNYYNAFHKWFLFFAVIFGIFIPFIAIIFINLKVFLSVRKHEIQRRYFMDDSSCSYHRPVSDSDDREIRIPLYRHSSEKKDNCRPTIEGKWTSSCFVLCRNHGQEEVENDFDNNIKRVSMDNETNQSNFKSLFETNGNGSDADENTIIRNTTCDDKISSGQTLLEVFNCFPDQNKESTRMQIYHGHKENLGQNSGSTFNKTNPSQHASYRPNGNIDGDTKGLSTAVLCDENLTKTFSGDSFIQTEKQNRETTSDFNNLKTHIRSLEQMSFRRPNIVAVYSPERKMNLLTIHHKLYGKMEILATPRRLHKQVNGTINPTPNNLLKSHYSSVTTSLPSMDFKCIPPVCDNISLEREFEGIYTDDLKIPGKEFGKWSRCKKKNNTGMEEKDKNISLSSRNRNSYETRSHQNFNKIAFQNKRIAPLSDIYVDKSLTTSSMLSDYKQQSIRMDNGDTMSVQRNISNIDQSNQHSTPLLESISSVCPKQLTSVRETNNSVSNGSYFDVAGSCPTLLKDTHPEQPRFFSTCLAVDGPLDRQSHYNDLTKGPLSLAIFKSVTETYSENTDSNLHRKLSRRFSEPDQSLNKNLQTQTQCSNESRARPFSEGEFSLRKTSCSPRGSFGQTAYISKKVARTVALVCASFILAWVPFFTVIIVNTFCVKCNLAYVLNAVLMITFAQSASNPVIYALCHMSFRNAYKQLFKKLCIKSD